MCLAIPLRIIELSGVDGVGEAGGLRRAIRLDFINQPKVGDYVMVHAGFAFEKLDEVQALANLRAIQEAGDAL